MDNKGENNMKESKPWIIYLAIVAVLAFMGYITYIKFGTKEEPNTPIAPNNEVEPTNNDSSGIIDDNGSLEPIPSNTEWLYTKDLTYKLNGKDLLLTFSFKIKENPELGLSDKIMLNYYIFANNNTTPIVNKEFCYSSNENEEEAKRIAEETISSIKTVTSKGLDIKEYVYLIMSIDDYNKGYDEIYLLNDEGTKILGAHNSSISCYNKLSNEGRFKPTDGCRHQWYEFNNDRLEYLNILSDICKDDSCNVEIKEILIENNEVYSSPVDIVIISDFEGAEGPGGLYFDKEVENVY